MSAITVEEKSDVEVAEKTEPPPNALDAGTRIFELVLVRNKDTASRPWGCDASIFYRFCRRIFGDSLDVCNG